MNYKLKHSLVVYIFAFICWLVPSIIWASVEVDGIYYDLNATAKTATVVAASLGRYTGAIEIPSSFVLNDISYSVKNIDKWAFNKCNNLISVSIPNSVNAIGSYAFSECTSLTSVTIPNSVTKIDAWAFYKCESLSSILLPNKLSYIDESTFEASGLQSITIPNTVTYIYYKAFSNCSKLTSVILPSSVTCIDELAFADCISLEDVVFPEKDIIIRGSAFIRCSSLLSLSIPNSVTYIGGLAFDGTAWYNNQPDGLVYAGKVAYDYKGYKHEDEIIIKDGTLGISEFVFQNCNWLTTIHVPSSVVSIGWNAFEGTAWYNNQPDGMIYVGKVAYKYKGSMSEGTEIVLNEGTKGIAARAFMNCTGLSSVKIPNTVVNIGFSAFNGCSDISFIEIPNSVTHIGSAAFSSCSGLTSVIIGNGIIANGMREFYDCSSLTSIYVKSEIPMPINWATFYNVDKTLCTLYVPKGSKKLYKEADYWKDFDNIIECEEIEESDTDISALDNAIYVEQTEGRISGTTDIPVKLKNSLGVRGFQFTLELPEGATINSWALNTNRLPSGATISDKIATQKMEGNKITVACSLNYGDATFTGNDGEIATVNVSFGEDMEVGSYPIYLTACDVTTASGVDEDLSDVKATLVLEDYVVGDANGDGKVRIGDATTILNYIVGTTSDNFKEKAADANGDGKIRIGDATTILNIIVNQ